MKFVHAADLHVDSPLRGLDRYEGAPASKLRSATRRALENLVATCIDERVAFLVLAGDVFDDVWKDYSTGLFFASQMARLREAQIPVVLLRGNHDAASSISKALRLPDNVRELSSKKPEVVEIASANACVHGQSFAQRAVTDDLAANYPKAIAGAFNVGLLHTCLDGREGHDPYAPTTIDVLRARGYDYWALGHVHAREVLSLDPPIVFSGNLQGRHARETGPKGASLVTVEGGVVTDIEHRAMDVVRWENVEVDASDASDALEIVDRACEALRRASESAENRLLASRLHVRGRTPANGRVRRDLEAFVSEVRSAAIHALGDAVWIEKTIVGTRSPLDLDRVREEASAIGHLSRRLSAIKDDPAELERLAGEFADLDRKLPVDWRDGDGARLTDVATIRAMIDDVEQTLLPRLLEDRET